MPPRRQYSGATPNTAHPRVYLEYLQVNDFKSYAKTHQLGPLKHGLNCIVGPNGSGKSNLMDAICFVLGLDSRQLRGLRINDLAHRREGQVASTANAHVSMQLRIIDQQESPPALPSSASGGTGHHPSEEPMSSATSDAPPNTTSTTLTTSRTVSFARKTVDGRSTQFYIDGQTVDKEAYLKSLATFGILPKVQNCIVSQGQVEALSLKSDKEKSLMMDEVSGSGLLREKYEALQESLKAARSNQSRVAEEVKALATEHRTLRGQYEELRAWNELEAKVKQAEADLFLFRLFVNEGLGKEAQAKLSGLEEEAAGFNVRQKEVDEALSLAEHEKREAKAQGRAVNEKAAGLQTELSDAQTKVVSLKRKIETMERNRERQEQAREERRVELTQIHSDFHHSLAKWESLVDKRTELRSLHSAELEKNAFYKLPEKKKEAVLSERNRLNALTGSLNSELKVISTRLEAKKRELTELSRNIAELQTDESKTRELLSQQTEAISRGSQSKIEPTAQRCAALRAQVNQMTAQVRELRAQRDALSDAVESARRTLSAFSHYRSEDQRALKFQQTLRTLQKEVPGVFDRVTGLCELTNQRYATAVSTAFGLQADSIVVDTFATAKRALGVCKRLRVPPVEFLPLETIKSRPLNPRLRNYGDLFTPVVDCISFDPKFASIFDYLLEDTVVVKDLSAARNVAFKEARKLGLSIKVVTLDGQTILKNCNIKLAAPRTGKLDRFAEKQRAEATAVLENSSSKLTDLEQQLRAAEVKLYGTEGTLADERLQLESYRLDVQSKTETVRKLEEMLRETQENLSRTETRMVEAEQEINGLTTAKNAKQAEINRVQATACKDKSIQKLWEAEQQMTDLMTELENALSAIHQEEQLCGSKFAECIRRLGVEQCNGNAKSLEALAEYFQTEYSALAEALDQPLPLSEQARRLPSELASAEAEHSAITAAMSAIAPEKEKVDSLLKEAEGNLQKLMEEKRLIHHRLHTNVHQVREATEELSKLDRKGADLLSEVVRRRINVPVVNGTLEDLELVLDGSTMAESNVEIDYSSLIGQRIPFRDRKALQTEEEKLIRKHEGLKEELESRGAQNHKAQEAYESIKGRLKEANGRLLSTKREVEGIERDLIRTREIRRDRYMKCFEHTKKALAEIYGLLTRPPPQDFSHLEESIATRTLLAKHFSEVHGGSATLELDDPTSDEPFNKGLIFTAMPYGKRYTEMELLSGGEKSMATLALLFSFQAFRPSPFVVLDEVDAALDAANVDSLRRFLKEASFQVIIVTLKEEMYCHADAIIGVYKDHEIESSQTVTLDVEAYPETVAA